MKRPYNRDGDKRPWVMESKPYGNQRYQGSFYQTKEWKHFRAWYRSTHAPVCKVCGTYAKFLDHIKPISEGGARLDPDNVQWLCVRHNTIKSNQDRTRKKYHDDPYDDLAR